MQAAVVNEYGDVDVLRVQELPSPRPGQGQVSIDVAFAGVNYAEVMARRGFLPAFQPPFVPGLEVSGTVRELGAGVEHLRVGQPVAALTTRGGYAEVAIAPATLTYPVAAGMDLRAAAALPTIVPTAYALLHEIARVRPGDSVLVHAAAGGVGTVAGQLARHAGVARVHGVTSTAEKAQYARRFGYDEVFLTSEWEERCGCPDVILDSIGGATRRRSFERLAPLGRLVIFGNADGGPETMPPGDRLRTSVKSILGWSITGLAAVAPERVARISAAAFAVVERGEITVDITATLTLAEAGSAHRLLEARRSTGKLVLAVGAR